MNGDNKIIQFPLGNLQDTDWKEREDEYYLAENETQTIQESYKRLAEYYRENRLFVSWDSFLASVTVVKGKYVYIVKAKGETLISTRRVTVATVCGTPNLKNMVKKIYDGNHNVVAYVSKHGQLVFEGDDEAVYVGGFRPEEEFEVVEKGEII